MSSSISRSEAVAEVMVTLAGMPEERRQEFISFLGNEEKHVWHDFPCSISGAPRMRFSKNGGLGPNGSCTLTSEVREKIGAVNTAYYQTMADYARELHEAVVA